MEKFFREAIKQSRKSAYKMKLGAVVLQKNKVVGRGFNIAFSTGNPHTDGKHAEMSALNKTTAKYRKNSTVIVGRLNKMGELAKSKPCSRCETVMRKMGVKNVWYTDSGGWRKMRL